MHQPSVAVVLPTQPPPDALAAAVGRLTADEQQRLRRFVAFDADGERLPLHRTQPAVEYVTARVLLQTFLTAHGISRSSLTHSPTGKPTLPPPFNVNWSHDGCVCFAAAQTPIGVDVVSVERLLRASQGTRDFNATLALLRPFLTPHEHSSIAAAPTEQQQATTFAVVWAVKESVLKCLGHGLTVDPSLIDVEVPRDVPRLSTMDTAFAGVPVTVRQSLGPPVTTLVAVLEPGFVVALSGDVTPDARLAFPAVWG